jgi:hypothetical protein
MDTRAHERGRTAFHEMVNTGSGRRGDDPATSLRPLEGAARHRLGRRVMPNPARGIPAWVQAARALAGAGVALMLLAGLAGGLRRAGVELPVVHAAGAHAALMIGGFFATVIGVERAVALHTRWAWLAPALAAVGGVALTLGAWHAGHTLMVLGALVFVAASVEVLRRQRAAHTVVLLLAALCGLLGSVAWASGVGSELAIAAWFQFLVLTIAAERLEMTRLMRRRPSAGVAFGVIVAGLLLALPLLAIDPRLGAAAYGAGLLALAIWLALFDIARITIGTHGLSRYMAVALLAGYGWLAVGGAAWIATGFGLPWRDAALHAIGLGFVFSMVMAHAPVIAPAIVGIKLQFEPVYYLPLAFLHGSLALRVGLGLAGAAPEARAWAAGLNVAALLLFAATLVRASRRWHRFHTRPAVRP